MCVMCKSVIWGYYFKFDIIQYEVTYTYIVTDNRAGIAGILVKNAILRTGWRRGFYEQGQPLVFVLLSNSL